MLWQFILAMCYLGTVYTWSSFHFWYQ